MITILWKDKSLIKSFKNTGAIRRYYMYVSSQRYLINCHYPHNGWTSYCKSSTLERLSEFCHLSQNQAICSCLSLMELVTSYYQHINVLCDCLVLHVMDRMFKEIAWKLNCLNLYHIWESQLLYITNEATVLGMKILTILSYW